MKSFKFEENPYIFLYIDLLSKCNMNCNVCYNSNLPDFELKLSQVENLFQQIPKRAVIRYLGGEPTLHPNFFEFIDLARSYGHMSTMSSNGIKYADEEFVKKLADPRYNDKMCAYSITLNGGLHPDHPAYQMIDGDRLSGYKKLEGLRNLLQYGVKNIYLTAIICRGLNEGIIGELYSFAKSYPDQIAGLKFRAVGVSLGSRLGTRPISSKEFREELFPRFVGTPTKIICDGITDTRCDECCYEVKKGSLSIKHVEFDSPGACACWKRGYVDFENELIYPFFEYQKSTFGGLPE